MILLVESRELQRVDRPKRSCRDQHPRPSAGAASQQLIFRRTLSPWSWHHFGRVGPDGCPGFKGPFPQPVSMSGAKCRCDSALAQGTRGRICACDSAARRQSARGSGRRPEKRRRPFGAGGGTGPEHVPKTVRDMDVAAGVPRDGFTTFFGTCSGPGDARPARTSTVLRQSRRRLRLHPSFQCINVLAH